MGGFASRNEGNGQNDHLEVPGVSKNAGNQNSGS